MYKLFVRPHLDYGAIIYHDQNISLSHKLESIQYEAALAVSGAWKGTNTDRILEKLGWETLGNRRWYRRLCLFYKIVNNQAPEYLRKYVPDENRNHYQLRHTNVFRYESSSSQRYSKSFFPYCVNIWNKLDYQIRTCSTISQFKTALLSIIRPAKKSLHEITNRHHSALITRFRVHFSDLNEHRFRHNFACVNPICSCKEGVESTTHFFLHCPLHLVHRNSLLGEVSGILNNDVTQLPDDQLCNLLLFGSLKFNKMANIMILDATARFLVKTNRFK